ncbi:MAG: transcriptional repressor [Bacteroidales bacterium]|nr:transcriptional repressor [Bacteroidales bacterium]
MIARLLEERGIRATANRILVAGALARSGRPLSLMELEDMIGSVDKSGIFRCLSVFKEKHLVHAIDDSEGTRYELCLSHGPDSDDDTHVHFYCERCHRTFCLENLHIPPVTLPKGYDARTANYVLKGVCPYCNGYSNA